MHTDDDEPTPALKGFDDPDGKKTATDTTAATDSAKGAARAAQEMTYSLTTRKTSSIEVMP